MSVGDGREGKVRAALHGKGQLGGKLAGKSLPRQIVHIALWPLLEQVMSFICSSTSLFLATHMGTEGDVTEQIASGIGVTGYVMWLGFLMQGAVGMGATAIVSRMTGARKFGEANYTANQAAMLGLLAGVLSAVLMYLTADFLVTKVLTLSAYAQEVALTYMHVGCWVAIFSGIVFAVNAALRGAGDTRTPFFIMLAVDGLNIVFSLLFVKVFGMFIEGLALGMIAGMAVAAAILVGILVFRSVQMRRRLAGESLDAYTASQSATYVPPLYLSPGDLLPNLRSMYRILSIGLPQALEIGGIWLIQIYVLRVISGLGDAYVGAHNIAIRIESMSFLPGFAIGMAGATLVGQYLGTGSVRMALETIRKCVLYSVIFMGLMGVVFYAFPEVFVVIFASNSEGLMRASVPVVQVFLLVEPFYAAMLMIKMCLRGAGDTRRVMYVSYGCMGFFRVGCLFLWSLFWPETLSLVGIWLLFTVDLAVEYFILNRMLNGLKWARRKV
ncbi:MAG: MATE family efflux transporter [Akkermansia sp.]|nr:MATE family efflux transporter [Akkermansia sp.]MBQ7024413.1 MATE family efflux transporter [Akkermansia sp.]